MKNQKPYTSDLSTNTFSNTQKLFQDHRKRIYRETDQLFMYLMILQWISGILTALIVSPQAWAGTSSQVHVHVWSALILGGIISAYPIYLVLTQSGEMLTRQVIAVAQMLWSALLIHLTGGRIETHFHVFGSLAFLSFYRDWKVLIPATVVIAGDHFFRGIYWPQSVYGVITANPWRWIEHAWWVIFEDVFLFISCRRSVREMWSIANHAAQQEATKQVIEAKVLERTEELKKANEFLEMEIRERNRAEGELKETQAQLVESEKSATVARLAAGAAHEVKNPLAILRQGVDYLSSQRTQAGAETVTDVLGDMSDAVNRADFIIRGLLEVSTLRSTDLELQNLNSVIEQALILSKNTLDLKHIKVVKNLAVDLPKTLLGKNRIMQVFINLFSNATDAMLEYGSLTVRTYVTDGKDPSMERMTHHSKGQFIVTEVLDTGSGIASDIVDQIFEPFFTTKRNKGGTGLGLPIVRSILQAHGGDIEIKNRQDTKGTQVLIILQVITEIAGRVT